MKLGTKNKHIYLNPRCTVQKLIENHKSFILLITTRKYTGQDSDLLFWLKILLSLIHHYSLFCTTFPKLPIKTNSSPYNRVTFYFNLHSQTSAKPQNSAPRFTYSMADAVGSPTNSYFPLLPFLNQPSIFFRTSTLLHETRRLPKRERPSPGPGGHF